MSEISNADYSIPVSLIEKLLSENDLQTLLKILTNDVAERFPDIVSFIFIYSPENKCLVPGSHFKIPYFSQEPDYSLPVSANGTTSSRAAYFKKPAFCRDLTIDEAWRPFDSRIKLKTLRSVISLPILSSKQALLGVFSFYFPRVLEDFPEETSFFQALTSIAAVTLERHSAECKTQKILEELKASQERLNLALQAQKMGVWDWDIPKDRLTWDNTVFEIFGSTKTECRGSIQDWQNRLSPDEMESKVSSLKRILEKQTVFEETFQIFRNGEMRNIACAGYVVRNSQGEPIRMTGLHWDITDKVIAHKKIEQERAKAIANSKMASLGEMASGVAHEVNNPLTIILNRANQLKARLQNDQFEKEWALGELSKIENTVERIAKIIRGLRAFSRNADTDPMISCELNAILEETLELCREKFKRYGISLSIQGFQNSFSLKCRPSQISQVLLNLFNNSFDAIVNSQNPWIELDISIQDNLLHLRVTDSGHGIPAHIADRMMDPFFSTKEVGRGTGLGLSISRGIMEDHGGRVWYDRDHPHTSFVLEIPYEEILAPSASRIANSELYH